MSLQRCPWGTSDPLYLNYHDQEWGTPLHDTFPDERRHFEFLVLESFQSGLSWITILKKREAFRKAFHDFVPEIVASYGEADRERLLSDSGIIRNKAKISAAINNAQCFLKIQKDYGSYDQWIWSFVDHQAIQNQWGHSSQIPNSTELSDEITRELKGKGFKFVGTTVVYAYMQAIGLVNDHLMSCFRHKEVREIAQERQ